MPDVTTTTDMGTYTHVHVEHQDANGQVIGWTDRQEPKPGTPAANRASARDALVAGKAEARARITAAQTAKASSTTVKQMPFTTVAEGRTQVRALSDLVNDLAQLLIESNRAQLNLTRWLLADFDTPPE